jgi:hypothetical protein
LTPLSANTLARLHEAITLNIFLIENRRVLFPGHALPLTPAARGASSFEESPHIATESACACPDRKAGSFSSGARSVGHSIHTPRRDQVPFEAPAKIFADRTWDLTGQIP